MTRMSTFIVLLVIVASSGCLSGTGDTPNNSSTPVETTTPGEIEGYLMAYTVSEVPEGATVVNASDERIRNVTLVQRTVENVTETRENTSVHVRGERLKRVQKPLNELQWYSGSGPHGHYIRKNDTVVLVYLKVLD